MIVDVDQGDGDLSPLADAVEKHLKPPGGEYAVHAERLDGELWEVQVGVL